MWNFLAIFATLLVKLIEPIFRIKEKEKRQEEERRASDEIENYIDTANHDLLDERMQKYERK